MLTKFPTESSSGFVPWLVWSHVLCQHNVSTSSDPSWSLDRVSPRTPNSNIINDDEHIKQVILQTRSFWFLTPSSVAELPGFLENRKIVLKSNAHSRVAVSLMYIPVWCRSQLIGVGGVTRGVGIGFYCIVGFCVDWADLINIGALSIEDVLADWVNQLYFSKLVSCWVVMRPPAASWCIVENWWVQQFSPLPKKTPACCCLCGKWWELLQGAILSVNYQTSNLLNLLHKVIGSIIAHELCRVWVLCHNRAYFIKICTSCSCKVAILSTAVISMTWSCFKSLVHNLSSWHYVCLDRRLCSSQG